jgi:bifunctional DNA-binding transcriptional regulator/antitoxin component of YhaV-PrlF toxin-antitoxin module
MVIPKPLRDELGVIGPAEVEITATDGRLEVTVPDVPARVEERDGLSVIVTDEPMAPMSVEETRAAIDRARR